MHLTSLLDIVADALPDRTAVGPQGRGLTYQDLLQRAQAVSRDLRRREAERLVAVDVNSEAVPLGLFAAAVAGIPYVPVNYRLADAQLAAILERAAPGLAVVEASVPARFPDGIPGLSMTSRADFLQADGPDAPAASDDAEDPAVLLFTSGTTGEPKAAVLRHRHLTSYVLETVEFLGAESGDAALVSVPPYHIAGIAAVLTSVWSGRRLVYLPQFSPEAWVDLAASEAVTHAMVVPTMLDRILDVLDEREKSCPPSSTCPTAAAGCRSPSWSEHSTTSPTSAWSMPTGSPRPAPRSPCSGPKTIARPLPRPSRACASGWARSVVPSPTSRWRSEVRRVSRWNRATTGRSGCGANRSPVSTSEVGGAVNADGWLATNDGGWLDADGYLFVEGRLDDVIVRGGENLSPGEIEDVLVQHPAVAEAAVIGIPSDEWGEAVAAVVVVRNGHDANAAELPGDEPGDELKGELRVWVSERLRSTRAPERIEFRTELPYSDTGKLLRRVLKAELSPEPTD